MKKLILLLVFIQFSQTIFAQKDTVFELLKKPDNAEKCQEIYTYGRSLQKRDAEKCLELLQIANGLAKKLNNDSLYIKSKLKIADVYYWEVANYPLVKSLLKELEGKYFNMMTNRQKYFYHSLLGDAIYYDNNYVTSMQEYYKALEYVGSDSIELARLYHNMGWVYADLNYKDKAIYFGEKALAISKRNGDKIIDKLNGLVYIYAQIKQYDKALSTLEEVDKISQATPFYSAYRKSGIYDRMGDIKLAAKYAFKGYELSILHKSPRFELSNLQNYIVYSIMLNNISEAEKYFPIFERLADSSGKSFECSAIYTAFGDLYLKKGKLDLAKTYLDKALKLQKELSLPELGQTYRALSDWYDKKGDIQTSRQYLLNYVSYKDSLDVQDSIAAVKTKNDQLHMYEMENVLNLQKAEMQKNALQLEKEKMQKFGFLIGLVILFLFSIVIYRNLVGRKKINAVLTQQKEKLSSANEELQQQNEEIATQRDEIEKQKELVEENQKEIIDSIQYAKRIQTALLPSATFLQKNLVDYFVLYKPKDIVSGDFYWSLRIEDDLFIAAADCTGHGVPGAFMSMIGINLLNEITLERKISNPARVLDILREEIIRNLNPEGAEEAKDGMDMVLCKINLKTNNLEYAASNNAFYIVRNSTTEELKNLNAYELITCKADKMPVGKYHDKEIPFTNKTLQLQKGDAVYLITDGYPDQFGGPRGKKFKYKPLEELLLANTHLPMQEQQQMLNNKLNEWQGFLEQVDDITVLGIRV